MFLEEVIEKKVSRSKRCLDYFAFGKLLRSFNGGNKYGHQGSQRESELSDNDYYTHFRGLDDDVARWKQVDPKFNPSVSPYASMENNPVMYNDVFGDAVEGDDKDKKNLKSEKVNTEKFPLNKSGVGIGIPEVLISVKKPSFFSKIVDWLKGALASTANLLMKGDRLVSGNGGYQKGGIEFYAPTNGSDEGTKIKTTQRDVKSVNIDYLIAAASTMFKSPFKMGDTSPLNPATIIGDGGTIGQEIQEMLPDEDTTINVGTWGPNNAPITRTVSKSNFSKRGFNAAAKTASISGVQVFPNK